MINIEFRHLRAVQAIHQSGGLVAAAETLNMTQSALSHQVRGLEQQVGVELFVRRSRPLRLSVAGERFLQYAEHILPKLQDLTEEMSAFQKDRTGRLSIAIECHACFEWLFPVLDQFRKKWQDIEIDIRPGLAFEAIDALLQEKVDIVIGSDFLDREELAFVDLFCYEPILVAAKDHPLMQKDYILPEDLRDETIITYPIEKTRLDVFSQFLMPANVQPKAVRQVELTSMILLLVASGRGVSVLPNWVLSHSNFDVASRPLTRQGLSRPLYAICRASEQNKKYYRDFFALAKNNNYP